ncbi:hypothetical protein GCM10011325_02710 [Dyadobacter sediminis]|nr:hypothetical protein GCM10011325_02710 [Dyadobacter sediminis]
MIPVGNQYIRSIQVIGAKEATLDTVNSYIQVVLPADYTENVLDLAIELEDGMKLGIPPDSALFVENHVRYNFMGIAPIVFGVSQIGNQSYEKQYTVFVRHEGKLIAKLTSPLRISADNSSFADTSDLYAFGNFHPVSGLGSIPDTPGGTKAISFELKDVATGQRAGGINYEVFPFQFEVAPVSKFLSSSKMQLTMRYGEKSFQFPDISKLEKTAPSGRVYWYNKELKNLTYSKSVTVLGGTFLPEYSYQVTLSNDRMVTPRTINAKIRSFNQLVFDIPADVPEDQYVVNVYQGSELAGISTEAISRDSMKLNVAKIWNEYSDCPFNSVIFGNVERTTLRKGQLLYAMPFPAITSSKLGSPPDPNKPLPSLQLKSGNTTILLKGKVQADPCYADASRYLYYGAYTLPADLVSGKYEARFISDKNETSLPYWSLIEIQ